MHKKRIVFFGTRGQELTSCHLAEFIRCNANIVGFVEAPPGSISTVHIEKDPFEGINEVAIRLNRPLFCPKNPKDKKFFNELKKLKADVFIVVGYQFFLSEEILNIPRLGAINFHTSLLPRHAGMHPGFWTIWYGDHETGMVIHFMDDGIDTGDIIYETRVQVKPGDTIDEVYHRVWKTSTSLVEKLSQGLDDNNLPRRPQDLSKYFYNYEITEKDFELDFRQPAIILYGRVMMRPGKFYFNYKNEKYYVKSCNVIDEPVKSRKFLCGIPYIMNNKIVFVTPIKFLQINSVTQNGLEIEPLSIIH
jgi:methionyl-tRNA formyltransferase